MDRSEDKSKIFSALIFLYGVDMPEAPGVYLFSIEDVRDKFDKLFNQTN